MTVAQITDIHISPDLKPVHDVDVVRNFKKILEAVNLDTQVTHIALTGDLCFQNGTISTMEWVKAELDALDKPYYVIPGNHDNSVIMGQVFDLEQHLHSDELYYNVEFDDGQLIFLDTAKGSISVDQISWLKAIDSIISKQSVIFMHHPPVTGLPFMDQRYALEDMDEVQKVLSGMQHVQAVFCGHYHIAKNICRKGMPPVYMTPSTFFQIDDRVEEFKIDSYRIAWRKIVFNDDQLESSINWMEP